MIYVTAQLVHSGQFDVSSINAFQHRSERRLEFGADPVLAMDQVAQDAGELIAANVTLPPGGNAVEAYIDVIANDDLDIEMLDIVINNCREALNTALSNELIEACGAVVLRYYFRPSLDGSATYNQLTEAVRNLFLSPKVQPPLTVLVERVEDDVVFRLDDESAKRMQTIHGSHLQTPRVRVTRDVLHDFHVLHGDIAQHLVDIVTGLDAQYVRTLGGVRFVISQGEERYWPEPNT